MQHDISRSHVTSVLPVNSDHPSSLIAHELKKEQMIGDAENRILNSNQAIMGHNLHKNINSYKDAHILKREVIKSGLSKAGSSIIGGFNHSTVPEQFGQMK